MKIFRRNIDRRGRWLRGVGAFILGLLAFLLSTNHGAVAVALAGGAVFMGFEALRGWCALRACGLKTKF